MVLVVAVATSAMGAAFLDGFATIHVPLTEPEPASWFPNRIEVTVDGRPIAVRSVKGTGEPASSRSLPRTPGRVVLPGTIQSAVGGKDWDPDGESTQMTEVSPGLYQLDLFLRPRHYEFKVARNGSWEENYGAGFAPGGPNIGLDVPKAEIVRFVVDFNHRRILDSIDNRAEVKAPDELPVRRRVAGDARYPIAEVVLAKHLGPMDVSRNIRVKLSDGREFVVYARDVLDDRDFVEDVPLGSHWTPTGTTFRVWSPVCRRASVVLYASATGGPVKAIRMARDAHGVWSAVAPGDLNGVYYRYDLESYQNRSLTTDINCEAASADSSRSMVVDLSRTDPPSFLRRSPTQPRSPVDAVVYEVSVRDLSSLDSSGVSARDRGHYAGVVEKGTRVPGTTDPTGLDYLAGLGITHLHVLPCQDFLYRPGEYSWGYATHLFDLPVAEYSSASDPAGVIREFKRMVSGLHRRGIDVVMDVVYNHTWPAYGQGSPFWQTVPYYYCRTDPSGRILNESGVGNSFDDERPMARKYIIDSLRFWTREYGVNGFRFDLLGIFTPETVRAISQALHRENPRIVLYGEPWTGGGPVRFGKGDQRGLGVGVFNDSFRNAMRGDIDGDDRGFVLGGGVDPNDLMACATGWIDRFAEAPSESVNYVSAHDNLTLWDRLARATASDAERRSSLKFADACVLLSQGLPFLEGGAELGRTKGGNPNSYDAGDRVNGFDWRRGLAFQNESAYLAGLIRLRKAEPGLRLRTAAEIHKRVKVIRVDRRALVFEVDQSGLEASYRRLLVIWNGQRVPLRVALPAGTWHLLCDADRAGIVPLGTRKASVTASPLSAVVAAK